MSEKIQIRFDGPPGPEAGRFVEVEDTNGKSIRVGEWVQDGGYWLLVIDLAQLPEERAVVEAARVYRRLGTVEFEASREALDAALITLASATRKEGAGE